MHLATHREATQARYRRLYLAMSHLLLHPEHQMLAHSGHYMTVTSHVPRPVIRVDTTFGTTLVQSHQMRR